jgi:pantoate--beta-alanine ligase
MIERTDTSRGKDAGMSQAPDIQTVPFTRTVRELRAIVAGWRKAGQSVGLIPTMGALHAGHLELVRSAKRRCDRAIVSIFVNPAQFAPNEDFDQYPRTWESDLAQLSTVGCDLVWSPERLEMYPEGFDTRIEPKGAALGLETDFRPQFFSGVATVCCKLFTQVGPDIAVFGEKDYQQLCVVRQMVRDLNLPLKIVGAETIREADGLAMSSRNRYLSPAERAQAVTIHHVIQSIAQAQATEEAAAMTATITAATGSDRDASTYAAIAAGRQRLADAGFGRIDYIEIRDAETLQPVLPGSNRPKRVLAAAWLGTTRLIDNVGV